MCKFQQPHHHVMTNKERRIYEMTICILRARFCFVISSSKICHSDPHLPLMFISYSLTQNISYPIVLQNPRADPFTTWPCKYMSTPPASIPPLAPTTEGRLLATPPDAHHWHHASQMPPIPPYPNHRTTHDLALEVLHHIHNANQTPTSDPTLRIPLAHPEPLEASPPLPSQAPQTSDGS